MTPSPNRGSRRGLIWAIVGAVVLLIAILAIAITAITSQQATPTPTGTTDPTSQPSTPAPSSTAAETEFVDASAADSGWVPEPITADPDVYIRAALEAASTFDTTLSSRQEWLAYLDSWFTPDTRYTSEADRQSDMAASQLELRQGVVLPEAEWDSLANEDGRVIASTQGEISYTEVPDDPGGMYIGTADVVLTFTRSAGSDGATSYEDTVRVSVQVLCGDGSVPTPSTAQQAGDCKVVRYFSGSLEP